MNVKSVKRSIVLTASTVGAGGAMMLAPAVANAATTTATHAQATSHVSRTSDGWGNPGLGDRWGNPGLGDGSGLGDNLGVVGNCGCARPVLKSEKKIVIIITVKKFEKKRGPELAW